MQGRPWILLVWLASLAAAWFAGQHLAGPGATTTSGEDLAEENARLREEIALLERAREARGPELEARGVPAAEAGGAASAPQDAAGAAGGGVPAEASAEDPGKIDLAKIQTPEELSQAFLAYASAMLAKGREGHLELLAWIGKLGDKENEQHFERIFAAGGERAVPGALYPVLKFAVTHEKQVLALTETFFEQAAEKPTWFEGMDDDPFELFTEGIGRIAPAVADDEQLARLRGYAKAILEQDEDTQPKALKRNRRDLERLLRLWAPPLPPEEILARLQAGTLSEAEIMSLLPTLPPEALRHVDLDRYVGPRVEAGDWEATRILQRIGELDAVTRGRLDQRVYRGAGAENSRIQSWYVRQYLHGTGRRTWADQRTFFETGLGMEGRTADRFADALMQLGNQGPDKEWVRWALGRFRLGEGVAARLKKRFGLTD